MKFATEKLGNQPGGMVSEMSVNWRNTIDNFRKNRRKLILSLAVLTLAAVLSGFLVLEILIYLCPFNPAGVEDKLASHARLYVDRNGKNIYASVSVDGFWRFPVTLDKIAPDYIQSVLNTEDKRFYSHHGVDWIAGFRAAIQYVRNGKVISGASTISMQLARLAHPEPRSLPAKCRQILRAMHIERVRNKDWILNAYLNLLPFGGNIEGVEAASRIYFDKPSQDLDIYESTLLSAIPQSPERLRPDKFPSRSRARQQRILDELPVELKRLSETAFHSDYLPEYARQTYIKPHNFPYLKIPVDVLVPESRGFPWAGDIHDNPPHAPWMTLTSLDAGLQKKIAALAQSTKPAGTTFQNSDDSDPEMAVVVIENSSGEIRVLYGDMNIQRKQKGDFVNAATSQRSPGSALKPWIYFLAILQGKIVPETILMDKWDVEQRFLPGDYRPQNFDPIENGKVSATDALAWSLNIPAVQLLALVGVDEFGRILQSFEVIANRPDSERHGLAMALGSISVTPVALAQGYFRFFRMAAESEASDDRDAARLLFSMLSSRPFPGFHLCPVSWKTGTSNGHRDAWCVAVTHDWTVCVWSGHKDGRSNKALTGIDTAQPLASAALSILHSGSMDVMYAGSEEYLNLHPLPEVNICRETGLAATSHCTEQLTVRGAGSARLSWCAEHLSLVVSDTKPLRKTSRPVLSIAEPAGGTYLADSQSGMAEIILSIKQSPDLPEGQFYWFLNGRLMAQSDGINHSSVNLSAGNYQLICMSQEGTMSPNVYFTVTR